MRSIAFVLVFLLSLKRSFCGNILLISGITSPSHHHYNRVLALGLVAKEHNLTFVSADMPKSETANLHYIHLEEAYAARDNEEMPDILELADCSPLSSTLFWLIHIQWKNVCDGILESAGIDVIQNYPDDFKFDAVIYDFTFGPCLLPLLHKFNYPPLIAVTAFANPPHTTDFIGGQKHPAFMPHYVSTYPNEMSFVQRFFNTIMYFVDWTVRHSMYRHMEARARKRFNFDFPSLSEISKKTVLMLVNIDSAIDFPEPLETNMIPVGGLQIEAVKALPDNMQKFINESKEGTILMSLGTNMRSSMLGENRWRTILETFAQLPDYSFLWKFESEIEDLPTNPSENVMIEKFLPQNDILAHPKLIAFITHSGALSTHEALWHGKPIIGMPFFIDQNRNMEKLKGLGVGVYVDFRTLSKESFEESILSVVKDSSYFERAQKISKKFQDKQNKPLDTAVWWIEYAMRNPDMENMKSPTLKLGWFASKSYDVLLSILVLLHILAFAAVKLVRKFRNLVCGSSKSNKQKSQ